MPTGITLCAIFRIPSAGLDSFHAYEDAVLALPHDHDGVMQRRLRTGDATVEVHAIWFPSTSRLDAYRADPRRAAHTGLFTTSGATAEVLSVVDVDA